MNKTNRRGIAPLLVMGIAAILGVTAIGLKGCQSRPITVSVDNSVSGLVLTYAPDDSTANVTTTSVGPSAPTTTASPPDEGALEPGAIPPVETAQDVPDDAAAQPEGTAEVPADAAAAPAAAPADAGPAPASSPAVTCVDPLVEPGAPITPAAPFAPVAVAEVAAVGRETETAQP